MHSPYPLLSPPPLSPLHLEKGLARLHHRLVLLPRQVGGEELAQQADHDDGTRLTLITRPAAPTAAHYDSLVDVHGCATLGRLRCGSGLWQAPSLAQPLECGHEALQAVLKVWKCVGGSGNKEIDEAREAVRAILRVCEGPTLHTGV